MIRIGFIHSLSGTMSVCEKLLAEAGVMAAEEINAAGGVLGQQIEYILEDGASNPEVFAQKAEQLISQHHVAALFGGWSSHTRKAIKPVVEQFNSSFWYPMSYEGLEASPNIFYTGSTVNQQVMPAIEWCAEQKFRSYYLLGSDYIFPITTNKLVRSMLLHRNLHICREIYHPLGHADFRDTIDDIWECRPDIIINTLNGDSNIYFFRQFHEAGLNAATLPVLSTSIAEPETLIMGGDSVGHYACWTYFESIQTESNRAFCDKYCRRFGKHRVISDPIVMAYSQLFMWKQIVESVGSFDTDAVRQGALGQNFDIAPGKAVMHRNQHLSKRAYIGQVKQPGIYDIVYESPNMVEPLPWLGVEKQSFDTSHLIIDILSRFPDAVDFNQCLQYKIAAQTTDLRHTLDKLHQAEKMQAIGELAGGIAHDFNNILGGILGYADLLDDSIPKQTEESQQISNIIRAAERARHLVQKILTFSKRNHEEKNPVYLEPIIEEVLSLLQATLPATIRIHRQIDRERSPILGNSTTIHEILLNIATNAFHAMDESGDLFFRCKEQTVTQPLRAVHDDIALERYTVIEIEDTGTGIDDEILAKIFDPFFTTKSERNGTGLGLAVVYGAMKDHRGYIQVESRLGEGTLFRLFFPQTNQVFQPERESSPGETVEKKSILLVDDELFLRDAYGHALRSLGYDVTTCDDAERAIEIFENQGPFDVLITDQSMPNMTGIELAEYILQRHPNFPIVLCTGYSSKVDQQKAVGVGVCAFLYKPVRKKEWERTISDIFSTGETPSTGK